MRKMIRYAALLYLVFSTAVFVRYAPIKSVFEDNPWRAGLIATVAAVIYRYTDD